MDLGKDLLKTLNNVEAEIGGEGSLPSDWISTGNYCLNKLMSGHLDRGVAVGRSTTFAGPSGVGKSLIMASIIREAGTKGYFTIIFDSESALDKNFLEALGVDVLKTAYLQVDTIEKFRNKAVELLTSIGDEKILIVLDSYGNLSTEKEMADALAGKHAVDMGTKAKAGRASFRVLANLIEKKNAALVLSNHTYTNASGYIPVEEMSAGKGVEYNSSCVVFLGKKKIKNAQEKQVIDGISIMATTQKNRFTPPFRKVSIDLSFDEGLSPYAGLLDLLIETGMVKQFSGGWYSITGKEKKWQKKDFEQIAADNWDEIKEFDTPKLFSSQVESEWEQVDLSEEK